MRAPAARTSLDELNSFQAATLLWTLLRRNMRAPTHETRKLARTILLPFSLRLIDSICRAFTVGANETVTHHPPAIFKQALRRHPGKHRDYADKLFEKKWCLSPTHYHRCDFALLELVKAAAPAAEVIRLK